MRPARQGRTPRWAAPGKRALECIAVADTQNFLDSLKNLRMVMSVALEHAQEHSNQFVKNATSSDVDQFERLVSQLRTLAEQLEKEFNTLEYLIGRRTRRAGQR